MKFIKKNKYIITIVLLMIIILSAIIIKKRLNNHKYSELSGDELINQKEITDTDMMEEELEFCAIDIKGAVNNPGVYSIECNKHVMDAIVMAGNLTDEADTSVINLAKKITNEMVIIIYTKDEVKNSIAKGDVTKVIENECHCPDIKNDVCINNNQSQSDNQNKLVNINTASLEEIQSLPGIGESKAKAIIEYRNSSGKFQNIEDVLKVSGIGEKLYEEIKAYITT